MNDISELLMVTGKIAGISGLTIGVFFLLFKDVIQKNIFSKLGKDNTYKIIRLFLILVWSVAFSGLLLWLVLSLTEKHPDKIETSGETSPIFYNNSGTIVYEN